MSGFYHSTKSRKHDEANKQKLTSRQKKRSDIEDINDFLNRCGEMFPVLFTESKSESRA